MDLIFDRTTQDVTRWQTLRKKGWAKMNEAERAEWLSAMKGAYGATDMNRVEMAVEALSARLRAMGYPHATPVVKTDWSRTDRPTTADFDRYFGNVEILRRAIALPASTPETPTTAQRLNHDRANNLEKILADIDTATNAVSSSWYYAGDIYLGEV